MKFKLSKEEFTALAESLQALYKVQGDGYVLDVDITQSPDFVTLTANRDSILDEKKAEEKKRLAIEESQEAERLKGLEEKKEYETLLGIKEEKFKAEHARLSDEVGNLKRQLENSILDSRVDKLAVSLAGDRADLIKPHIRARMVMKEVEGVQKLFITDITGIPSAMTTEQLETEFTENVLYAPVLAGRQSSGSGAGAGAGAGGGEIVSEWEQYFKPETRNLTKQGQLLKEDKELYDKLAKKYTTSGRAAAFRQVG